MPTKKKSFISDLKRQNDPLGNSSFFTIKHLNALTYLFFADDILRKNVYLSKVAKLADHRLGTIL